MKNMTSSTASQMLRSRTRNISSQPVSTTITEERNGDRSITRTTTIRYSNGSVFSSKELLATCNEVSLEDTSSHQPLTSLMLSSCDNSQGQTSSSHSTVYPELWLSVAYALMCYQAESSRLGKKEKTSENPGDYVDKSIHSFFVALASGILSMVFLVVENAMVDGYWYENPVRVVVVMLTVGFGVVSFIHYTIAFALVRLATKAYSDEMRKTKKEKDDYIARPFSLFVLFTNFLQILGLINFVGTLIMASIDEPIDSRVVLFLILWHSGTWWLLMLQSKPSWRCTSFGNLFFSSFENDNKNYEMIAVEHDIESQETLTCDLVAQETNDDLTEYGNDDSSTLTKDLNTPDTNETNSITSNTTYEPVVLGSSEE